MTGVQVAQYSVGPGPGPGAGGAMSLELERAWQLQAQQCVRLGRGQKGAVLEHLLHCCGTLSAAPEPDMLWDLQPPSQPPRSIHSGPPAAASWGCQGCCASAGLLLTHCMAAERVSTFTWFRPPSPLFSSACWQACCRSGPACSSLSHRLAGPGCLASPALCRSALCRSAQCNPAECWRCVTP